VDKSIYFHPSAVFMREGCKLIGKGFKTSLFQKISAPLVNNAYKTQQQSTSVLFNRVNFVHIVNEKKASERIAQSVQGLSRF